MHVYFVVKIAVKIFNRFN